MRGRRRKVRRVELDPTPDDERWWRGLRKVRRKLRLYADQQFPRQSVEALREKGLDVWYVQEHKEALHQDDGYHYRRARRMRRLLVTLDRDYLNDSLYPLHESPGVIVIDAGASADPLMPAAMLLALLSPILREGVGRIPDFGAALKFVLTSSRLVARQRTYDSRVEETVWWKSSSR